MDLTRLTTEQRNPDTMNIDELTPLQIVSKINAADSQVATAVAAELQSIANVIEQTVKAIKSGGRLIYIGAGTSGRLGVLDAAECPPTYGTDPQLVVALIAGGSPAFIQAIEGVEDQEELGEEDLRNIQISKQDMVIGLTASGRTPYVLGGIKYANQIGASTAAIVCSQGTELSKIAQYSIEVITGPEVITGSTRMKAGTAQKMVLNMISTGTMICLGKVYQNLMVDVKPANKKLIQRAKNIVMEATGCSQKEAELALIEHNYHAKPAILQVLTGESPDRVRHLLQKSDGVLRKALQYK